MPTTLVTVVGGTGFIGREVVRELLARGKAVGVLTRDPSKVRSLFQNRVEARTADVREMRTLAGAITGYVSGAGVDGGSQESWFQAKRMAEQAVKESGMSYTIVRPSWICGETDQSLNKFVLFARYLPCYGFSANTASSSGIPKPS